MTDTPLTDASISWRTVFSGYGANRMSSREDYVEVTDARAIERELREEIARLQALLEERAK